MDTRYQDNIMPSVRKQESIKAYQAYIPHRKLSWCDPIKIRESVCQIDGNNDLRKMRLISAGIILYENMEKTCTIFDEMCAHAMISNLVTPYPTPRVLYHIYTPLPLHDHRKGNNPIWLQNMQLFSL